MTMMKTAILAALAVTAYTAPAAAANLVTNGSFSNSTFAANSEFGASFGGQGVTGWTSAASNAFNIYFVGGTQSTVNAASRFPSEPQRFYSTFNTLSPDGGNFVALDGDSDFRGALTQTITGLTTGSVYNLSFYWAAGQFVNRTGATTEQLQVGFGGTNQLTGILSIPTGGFSGWKTVNMQFTAGGTSQVLSFLSLGTPNGLPPFAALDGVSLTAVPEPATWALLLTGFGMVGFAARRRRTSAVAA